MFNYFFLGLASILAFFIFSKRTTAEISKRTTAKIPKSKESLNDNAYKPFIAEKIYSRQEIDLLIKKYAFKYAIDENLLRAIIMVESSFNYKAVNKEGSYGLCQIHKNLLIGYYPEFKTKTEDEIKNYLFNAENNLDIAGMFLNHLFRRYKDINKVIQAYNLGETKFDKGYTSPDYLKKVLYYYNIKI